MERYFTIQSQQVVDDHSAWVRASEARRLAFVQLADEIGIESHEFYTVSDRLMVSLTPKDIEKFKSSLKQYSRTDFKKTSPESKRWLEILKEKGFTNKRRPFMGNYIGAGIGRSTSNILELGGVLYGYYECRHSFELPDGFTEIKAWEYYKAIDDHNDAVMARKDSADGQDA